MTNVPAPPAGTRRRWRRRLGWVAASVLLLAGGVALLDRAYPLPVASSDGGLVVTAQDGTPLRTWPGADGAWRYPVSPDEVSPLYLEALLGYEDRWFHYHPGVNPWAMGRAAWQWLAHGRIVSGGSTLTMQVARLIDPALQHPAPRTMRVKLRQMLRALQLELHYSKREILTLYLNHAPMGGIVEGVEMASRAWLGKPAARLSHAEAALLTALPQAPSRLRPDRHATQARHARDKVLARMQTLGVWDSATVADARIETVVAQHLRGRWLAPLAAQRVRDEAGLAARTGPTRQRIAATLDPEAQEAVERMLLDRVDTLPPRVSMAALVMDNDTLAVRAYAGSADFNNMARYAHVDMVRGVRSPGSTLKPFLYALALDEGLVHSESLLIDAPQTFGGYRPGNFQAAFSGPVSLSEALQRSLNVPAVDLLDHIGPAHFASALRAGGIRLRTPGNVAPNLSIILGGAGTNLEELVGAYRALARGGLAGKPRLTPQAPHIETRIMSEGAAFIVRDILESGGHPDRPFYAWPRAVAWKTGTSFGFRDAWALGVTDTHTIGVWVGRPDGTPNPGFFGANVAAPLLHDIVAALESPANPPRIPPASVSQVTICWPLGMRAELTPANQCHVKRRAWSLDGGVPPTLPDRLRSGGLRETWWIDPASGLRTRPDCPVAGEPQRAARWPVALQPWLLPAGLAAWAPPAWHPDCRPAATTRVQVDGLETGAVLRPAAGRRDIALQLQARGADDEVWWILDGQAVQRTDAGQPLPLVFRQNGSHSLTALDAQGRYDRIEFRVDGLNARQAP